MMVQVPIFPPHPDKVQIFHNTQARFKFPTHQVNAFGSPWGWGWGECWRFELIGTEAHNNLYDA